MSCPSRAYEGHESGRTPHEPFRTAALNATTRLRQAARRAFGWEELHPEQVRAMTALLGGRDVLAVLPTGAGKSAIYQVPALLVDGPTLIISPLLALQRDQIRSLDESNAPRAVAINSDQGAAARKRAWTAVRREDAEYLFLSPEQLAREDVVERLQSLGIALVAVDEAHCVSAWGHDFRPDYLRLAPVIERLGHPPVVAMTATAALPVRRDITAHLALRDPVEVIASFDRPNLHLAVQHAGSDSEKRDMLLDRVGALVTSQARRQQGLVYTASRKDAERIASELAERDVRALPYHAGMKAVDRKRTHKAFLEGGVDAVVATSAFGMGIDKPDVRFVTHASVPDSLDTYYQEIGRAGRDDEPAEIVLFYRPEDLALQKFLTGHRADDDVVRQVVDTLVRAVSPLTMRELASRLDVPAARRTRAVNLLEQARLITAESSGGLRYAEPEGGSDAAVAAAAEIAEQQQRLVRSRIEMMRGYAETMGCRRQFLLGYFGEKLEEPCGRCDTCGAGTPTEAEHVAGGSSAFAPNDSVRHAEWGDGVVMWTEPDRLTVLFDSVGYKILSAEAVAHEHLLQ